MSGLVLLLLTVLLTLSGLGLALAGAQGWAELLFVLASGTAGAGIVYLIDRK